MKGRKQIIEHDTWSSKIPVWAIELTASGDLWENVPQLSQSREMGCLSTNICQSLVQVRLLPRVMNSLAHFQPTLSQVNVLQKLEKVLRQTVAGAYDWCLAGIHGNYKA